ncbi:MAG: cysteine desulfurase-like protein [Anaerolineales bacterium]|nr:cysteine desulfurase-like protein [Anaerolineales bacterium]
MTLDLNRIREQFPSLDHSAVFFDNPGGTQIAYPSLERIQNYLLECNANHEGVFPTSQESDAILHEAHAAIADFFNAARPEEIIFGANMTTLTLHLSRSLAHLLNPGDEIVVTRLDHDANISPWLLIAGERGCKVNWIDFDVEEGVLNLDEYEKALARKPRLVAFGYASNALGTINPVRTLTHMAHEVGALVFVDAVQYAPHGPLDVQKVGCDFLVASAYKFFGPHVGTLYGRFDLLQELKAYKVRPASDQLPYKFETGTLNHEGIAGTLGAIEYLEWLGEQFGGRQAEGLREEGYTGRRLRLKQAMLTVRAYEFEISRLLLAELKRVPGLRIYGLSDTRRIDERVPTFSFRLDGRHPRQVAEALSDKGFYVWDGNYYALAVTEHLGLEEKGGMVRVGPVHYNTLEEIRSFGNALREIASK